MPLNLSLQGFWKQGLWNKIVLFGRVIQLQWALIQALRKEKAKALQFDFDVTWLVSVLPRILGFRTIQVVRNLPSRSGWRVWVRLLLADRTVFLTEAARGWTISHVPGLLKAMFTVRSRVIHNSIDIDAVSALASQATKAGFRAALKMLGESFAVIAVGSCIPRKGQLWLIREVVAKVRSQVPNVWFYFVGAVLDRSYYERCLEAAESVGCRDCIEFVGYTDNVARWYRAADVLAHASEMEGIPRVVLEAQCTGLPVVVRHFVGAEEALENGATGYLVRTADEFAEVLVRLARSPSLRERLGEEGWRFVRQHFEPSVTAQRYLELYSELLRYG